MPYRVLIAVAFALYPLLVYAGLRYGHLHWVASGLCVFALWRALVHRTRMACVTSIMACALAAASVVWQDAIALKLYPVIMNAAWCFAFAVSLQTVPAIERFARLKVPDLPEHAVAHCRQMTKIWCGFFVCNGLIALDSALWRSEQWWTLYNGAISYVLIGCMFAFEWCVRRYRQSQNQVSS